MTDLKKLLAEATPGPWNADGAAWNRIVWSSAENRVCFMAHSNGMDDERDIATSRLVALAPSLAAALLKAEEALAEICDDEMIWGEDYEVRAALNKAEDIARAALAEIKQITGGTDC